MGWKDAAAYRIVAGRPSGHSQPVYSALATQDVVLTALNTTAPSWASLAFSFKRPITSASTTIKTDTPFIMAWSANTPSPASSNQAQYPIHDNFATFQGVDFISAAGQSSTASPNLPVFKVPVGYSYYEVLKIHGALMFVAWAVIPFIAIFIARYLKRIGHRWYQLHLSLLLFGTGGLSLVSAILVGVYKVPPHFASPHEQLGLFILLALPAQIILGYVINALWNPNRSSSHTPWHDRLHAYFGKLIVLLALINIILGLNKFENLYQLNAAIYVVYVLWVFVASGLFWWAGKRYGNIKGHGGSEMEMNSTR